MNGACNGIFFAPPPGALGKGQMVIYHLISITKSISKMFIPNFVCVLTNERKKTISDRVFILLPGSCPRGVIWGCLGFKNQILSRRLSVISPPESLDQI